MVVTCVHCGVSFEAKRSTRRYCSQSCQKRARRGETSTAAVGSGVGESVGMPAGDQAGVVADPAADVLRIATVGVGVAAMTYRELEAAGKVETVTGRQALTVAARMDSPGTSGSEISSLSKELTRLMLLAVGRGAQDEDPVDEVKRKRDEKLAKARQATA